MCNYESDSKIKKKVGQSQEYAGILFAIGSNPKKADMKDLFLEFPAS